MHRVVNKQDGISETYDFNVFDHDAPLAFDTVFEAVEALQCETPIYVLYPDVIKARAEQFVKNFAGRVMYAVKANPDVLVLRTLWAAGIRHFDIASMYEAHLVKSILPDAQLYFMHPVKARKAIRESYALGIRHYVIDTKDELQKIVEETNHADDLVIYVRLRLNSIGAAYDLSGKFGSDTPEAVSLLQEANKVSQRLGVTFHVGSQCMDPQAFDRAIGLASHVIRDAGVAVEFIDVGGGFPVAYPGMTPSAQSDYFAAIENAIEHYELSNLELVAEPGRALMAEAGATLVRVELRREYDLYLNEGVYGSLFDAGMPAWRYPTYCVTKQGPKAEAKVEAFRFFGPTCDSIDFMPGPFYLPHSVKEGDWIEVGHLGAYGAAMATKFNGFHSDVTIVVPGIPAHVSLENTKVKVKEVAL